MSSQIKPTRQVLTDRLLAAGFWIKTDGQDKRYEVAVASDVSLFRPEAKPRRTKANFYSSRAVGLQPIPSGEAVYILPPEILARFVGQEKLYYALVTYSNTNNASPEIAAVPSEGSAYVDLKGVTGRSLKRVRVLPSRQRSTTGYGNGAGSDLEWGGDVSMPGTQPVTSAPTAPTNGKAATAPVPASTGSPAARIDYKDGFGPMPPAPITPGPSAASPVAPRAQSLAGALGYDVALIPQPDKLSCWAASMAMLVGFRRSVSISPETLAQEVGRSLRTSYGWDMLEAVKDHFGFQDIPLPSNASLYPSPAQWQDWLNAYGPLWVTTVGAPSHAIIVTGLNGDLTPDGTTVCILNPWDTTQNFSNDQVDFVPFNPGRAYTQSFADFAADFGNLGLDNYGNWRVLYLPPSAALSQGLGRVEPTRARNAARALTADPVDIHWGQVELVPEMPNATTWASALAMIIGWRDRVSIDPGTVANRAMNPADRRSLADAWNMTLVPAATYAVSELGLMLSRYGPLWVAGRAANDDHAFAIVGICGDGTADGTIVCIKDPWGNVQGSPRAPQQNPTPGTGSSYTITYRELARQYDPRGIASVSSATEADLQLIHSQGVNGQEPGRINCNAPQAALGLGAGAVRSRAQANECFSLNWDEVELIAQPTSMSCWATAAAMLIGWRDRVSLSPDVVAQTARRSTATGISPDDHCAFGTDVGLVCEAPQCYNIDGFRALLEGGPLWVGVLVPSSASLMGAFGHAIVVTGMYSDGEPNGRDTYIRVTDPWDRVVGSPGAPGAYQSTHNTGSRYIMSWADFTQEYETRSTAAPDGSSNFQILRAADSSGRQPSRSGAAGYAMAASAEDDAANSAEDGGGIDEGIPVSDSETASAQAYTRALDESADYPQASRFVPAASVNYRTSRTQRTIRRVVIHITDGGTRISGTIGWFQNPNQLNRRGEPIHVSAHYVVGQDGEVVQMVHNNDVAWHANSANGDSIGIEHVANTRGLMPSDAQYCASAALARWLCDTYSIPLDRTHVLGHSEADTRTSHTDCPNAVWNWEHYMDLVQTASCKARAQASGQAAALSNYGSQVLPPPPTPVTRVKAMDAGVDVASNIPGTTMERSTNHEGNISWELEQLRGLKHPNDTPPAPAALLRDATTIRLDGWPYVDTEPLGHDNVVSAAFTVDWQFNGKSVGNVRIANVGNRGSQLSELRVEARIADDPVVYPQNNPTYAALQITFTYWFKRPDGSCSIAKTNLHLLGDGTFDKSSSWERP